LTGTITFKHCGICGKLVKEKDSWITVPTSIKIGVLQVCQSYHWDCFEKEKNC